MMKLKLFLRNSGKSALRFSLLFSLIAFSCGCLKTTEPEPTYKEKDIPYQIQKICKDEYGIDALVERVSNTLWIYIPLTKLLHEKFNIEQGDVFSEQTKKTLMDILTSVSRVFLSSDKTTDFYVLTISDIEIGIDYGIIGHVLDIKKIYAGALPPIEFDIRCVRRFETNAAAINDMTGSHIEKYDIQLTDFLANQIIQRIAIKFQGEQVRGRFKIEELKGAYDNKAFMVKYKIEDTRLSSKKKINIREEILKIAASCLSAYEFEDYSNVELEDLSTGKQETISKGQLKLIKEF